MISPFEYIPFINRPSIGPKPKREEQPMKKLLTSLAAVLIAVVVTPTTAEANVRLSIGSGYTYVSGHASCGCPIYTKRIVRSFDRFNRPVYNYYRQPFSCRCRNVSRSRVVRHGYNSRFISPRFTNSRSSKGRSNARHVVPRHTNSNRGTGRSFNR